MDLTSFRTITKDQYDASLTMLGRAIRRCPASVWKKPVGTWPYWLVVYHTLCMVDVYVSKSNRAWKAHPVFHPRGRKDLADEYPGRTFSTAEMLEYLDLCREKVGAALRQETRASLAGRPGFSWIPCSRAELYLYGLRHVAHHTGQLTAVLRRKGVGVGWMKSGWSES